MEFEVIPPKLPSLRRWRALARAYPADSTLRRLEYEHLSSVPLSGRVLDVGGGAKARTAKHVPAGITLESVNIDPAIEPTWLIAPGEPFPVDDATFDAVLSFNTLEHVYDGPAMVAEMFRVLKPGGRAIITVPWIFRIHAHPDDYFRATPSWWRETLARAGFSSARLTPLVWGRAATAHEISGTHFLPKRVRRLVAVLRDTAYARLVFRGERYAGRRGERVWEVSLGWFIEATR